VSFVPGVGFIPYSRNMLRWAREWGTLRGDNFRSVFNSVIPVSVVDRFRDDDEGSVFGIWVESAGSVVLGERPACIFFSIDPAVEFHVHSANWSYDGDMNVAAGIQDQGVKMYTPIAPQNPVEISPVGLFVPGLITNENFTFGAVRGIVGRSLVSGFPEGFRLNETTEGLSNTTLNQIPKSSAYAFDVAGMDFMADRRSQNTRYFDPPVRVRSNQTLAFQTLVGNTASVDDWDLSVSILYTERRMLR
jgi:hypothetical protein